MSITIARRASATPVVTPAGQHGVAVAFVTAPGRYRLSLSAARARALAHDLLVAARTADLRTRLSNKADAHSEPPTRTAA